MTKDAGPALLMPVIIVGGIWSGIFTSDGSGIDCRGLWSCRITVSLQGPQGSRSASAGAQIVPDKCLGIAGHRSYRRTVLAADGGNGRGGVG